MKTPEDYLQDAYKYVSDKFKTEDITWQQLFRDAVEKAQKEAYNKALEDAVKNAECGFEKHSIVDDEDHFETISGNPLYDYQYKYNNFDSLPMISVIDESILKLKIKV
jgi:hypothetical protein